LDKRQKLELKLRPDSKGRVTLGQLAQGVSSYEVRQQADGVIILRPFREVPAREEWLWRNATALQAVKRGLDESAAGKTLDLGSFAQYADDEIE
jgi:hypothetical protein